MKEGPLPNNWVNLSPTEFVLKWYNEQYQFCTYCNAAGFSQKFMHRSIEQMHNESVHFENVLEIGANRGEHLEYVRHTFDSYYLTDIQVFDRSALPRTEQRSGLFFQQEDSHPYPYIEDTFA